MMKPEDFQRLEQYFERAVEADVAQREAIIRELNEESPELAASLRGMLAADAEQTDPIKGVVAEGVSSATAQGNDTRAGPQHIGPFEVISRLGAGGMGVVYLCRRKEEDFDQLVAVKRLAFAADTDFARQRLRMERAVLAGLRHPNIAQLIDGGEDENGTPFVAMEYVDGVSIDRYVIEQKLDREAQVRLFLALCEAVQFAHRNGVIHRDIKAANVQIDSHGQLKLLDFGIAKLVRDAEKPPEPMTVAASMTPDYASPEQVRGEPATQASDIYSMGVLLFELLAGKRPYDFLTKRPSEIERIVCETNAPPLVGKGAADLNSIIARAMHKQPERRYASAAELGDDLNRWLTGHPVEARPDSALYRASRFVRRHPFGTFTTALIALLLAGFGSVMAWQAHQLAVQRDTAEREARVAGETADFLVELFALSDPREGNPENVRARDLLARAAEQLPEQMESDPLGRARLMHVIGLAYANLGDDARGTGLLEQSLALRENHAGPNSLEVADALNRLGNVHRRFGRLQQAEPMLVRALEIREQAGQVDYDLADSYNNVGLLQNDLGYYERAEATLRRSITLHQQYDGQDTPSAASPLHNLALSLQRQGRLDEAREAAQQAIALKRAEGRNQASIANTLAVLANIERERGLLDEALQHSQESLTLREGIYGRNNVLIASGLRTHAEVLLARGDAEEAEALYREALALHEANGSLETIRAAEIQLGLGRLLMELGRDDESVILLNRAAETARRELPHGSPELNKFELATQLRS